MQLNVNHSLLNDNMQKESQDFQNLGVIHNDSRSRNIDL